MCVCMYVPTGTIILIVPSGLINEEGVGVVGGLHVAVFCVGRYDDDDDDDE